MAGSRIEKLGTIFSRVTGLLKSGALREDSKPLWYDVYAAFPPHVEPNNLRDPPKNQQIIDIFYAEDLIRANQTDKELHDLHQISFNENKKLFFKRLEKGLTKLEQQNKN